MEAVKSKDFSVRKAAAHFGIPRGTLQDKLSGRRQVIPKETTELTEAEEQEVYDWVMEMAARGFGRSKQDLRKGVNQFLDFKGRTTRWDDNLPGAGWFKLFKRRHPKLKYRKAQKLGKERAHISKEDLDRWFDEFTACISEQCPSLLFEGHRIFNADEWFYS